MDPSLQDLQQIFEYELKRKLSERAKTSSGEMKILLNGFKFFDLNYTGIINKNQWIQGVFRTGLTGFSESDLNSLFSCYDQNNSGEIDYKNFCSFLYGREPLNPLKNNSQSVLIQQNNNNNTMNNNIDNNNMNNNIDNNNMNINNNNQYNNQIQQNNIIGNYNENNNNNNNINNQIRKKTPMYNNNQNQKNNNNLNNQRNPIVYDYNNDQNNNIMSTPLINNNDYQDNSNFRRSQRKINSYSNTFNNIFQQDIPSNNINAKNNNNDNLNYNNLSESKINSILSTIRNNINTNNGITLYTFIKKLKGRQSNNSDISLNDLNNIFQEMRLNISLNDLKIIFNILNKNQNNNISIDELINLIKGNLDERRKIYIVGIFSNIDTEKAGEVSIQLLKNIYNTKNHPDVLNGTKSQEEAYEQFCYSLDLYCEINGISKNGNISFENFIDYYSGISSCIPDEVYFEDLLKAVWDNSNSNSNINSNNDINYNNNANDNINNTNSNINNENNNYGLNSILMGISPNDRNRNINNNQFNKSNRFNNNQFNNSNRFDNNNQFNNSNRFDNNNQFNNSNRFDNNNQFNNRNRFDNNNQFNNNDRRMKNSISSPFISENNEINRGGAQSNNNINNNINNQYPFKNNATNQSKSTPFNNSRRSPEGIKVYQKKRYNPITDEYYDSENTTTNNISKNDNINNNITNNQNIGNNNSNINKNSNNNSSGIIEQLRNILILRGPKSIFTFQRMLSIYDRNRTGQISLDDFNTIFQTYNLNLTNDEIQNIFKLFDTNQTGNITYDILLNNIIGQMNERRILSVKKVFDTFNKNENGEVLMSEIKQKYNPSRHPDVVNEKKNKEEVYGEFLDKLEIFREYNDNLKGSFSTTMNFNEFAMFYNEISMNIKDDNLFDYLLNNCWNLDKFSGNNQNVNNYNNFNNGNNQNINNYNNFNNNMKNNNSYNNNYERNIRARTGKQIMNMNNRGY